MQLLGILPEPRRDRVTWTGSRITYRHADRRTTRKTDRNMIFCGSERSEGEITFDVARYSVITLSAHSTSETKIVGLPYFAP
jgi:hypothetical protein